LRQANRHQVDRTSLAEVLNSADPSELAAEYPALRLKMVYNAAAKIVGVSIRSTGRGSNRVRGGTCPLTTRVVILQLMR
jgi:hypothetical protein